jgi:hypothetical protein
MVFINGARCCSSRPLGRDRPSHAAEGDAAVDAIEIDSSPVSSTTDSLPSAAPTTNAVDYAVGMKLRVAELVD